MSNLSETINFSKNSGKYFIINFKRRELLS